MPKPVTGLTVFENNTTNLLVNLDANFTTLANAVNDPGSYSNYAADSGAVNALVITLTNYVLAAYADGQIYTVKVANTNTGAATLNINSLGAKTIFRKDGTALLAGDLIAANDYQFMFNSSLGGGGFQLLGSLPSPILADASGNVILNSTGSALATSATAGFAYIPTCAGQPTGVPAKSYTGATPCVFDTTNNILWVYITIGATSAWIPAEGVLPQITQSASFTFAVGHIGTMQNFTAAAGTATIPANSAVAFLGGTCLSLYNASGGNVSLAITTDTLQWFNASGSVLTGTRTIANKGLITATKVVSTVWNVAGTGIS